MMLLAIDFEYGFGEQKKDDLTIPKEKNSLEFI